MQIVHPPHRVVVAPDGKVHKLYHGNEWKTDGVLKAMKAIGRGLQGHPAGRLDVAL